MGLFCLLAELSFTSSRVSSCPPGWLLLKAPRSWITGPEQRCRDRARQEGNTYPDSTSSCSKISRASIRDSL